MEEGQLVRCGVSGLSTPNLGRSLSLQGRQGPPSLRSDPPWKDRARGEGQDCRVAMVKPAVISQTTQASRKTNLSRSVSLSDKELKEARDRSQIIAAQLTFPSNGDSRGVQLFNRRRQRVNAFTRTSFGQGGDGPVRQPITWEEERAEREDSQSDCGISEPSLSGSLGAVKEGGGRMEEEKEREEEREEHVPPGEVPIERVEEERDQKLSGETKVREHMPKDGTPPEITPHEATPCEATPCEATPIDATPTDATLCEAMPPEATPYAVTLPDTTPSEATPPNDVSIREGLSHPGEREEALTAPGEVPNGSHVSLNTTSVTLSLSKQAPAIVNRTARPFGSPATVRSPEDFPPPSSCATPPLPRIYSPPPPLTCSSPPSLAYSNPTPQEYSNPTPQVYSNRIPQVYSNPTPQVYSNPTPQVYSNPTPQVYSNTTSQVYSNPTSQVYSKPTPPPYSNPMPPAYCSPPPVSRVISPSQYRPASAPRPSFIPELMGDRRSATPIKTGLLEDGKARRAARKSMFTFQEKPKVAPNPELLSLVQGVDERKKGPSLGEPGLEEELLALGAEASNFLPKDSGSFSGVGEQEAVVPEWSSCLKSSGLRVRCEPKPEQGLTNASGKGAELFARRQSRMERFVTETPAVGGAYGRAPSPTMSLPPSWTFPSNMPGRVKAMADAASSNIKAPTPRTAKPRPTVAKGPVPATPESLVLENGCTKLEMDISRHQPYQLNSSLFIFNPNRDPMSSLPKAAPPPPKPMVLERGYGWQSSLPPHSQPPPLSPHYTSPAPFRPFSPQVPPSPVNGGGFTNLRSNCAATPWASGTHTALPSSTPPRSERLASPRTTAQAPRPTFSAKRAGIEPQVRRDSIPTTPTTPVTTLTLMTTPVTTPTTPVTTPQQLRRFRGPEGPTGGVKLHSASPVQTTSTSSRSLHPSAFSSPLSPPPEVRCHSPLASSANRRLLAQNIINAAKRKNSPSPGQNGRSGGGSSRALSPFQPRPLGSQSPIFVSPPPTPTRAARSPVRLYATRSLTDSDASLESEDSGLRSPGLRSYNTCPRGWGGSLRIKRGSIPADL